MTYAELLSSYIEKSGKTLREVAELCNKKGYSLDYTYISKLKSGKRPPPSENLSRVLAEVLGVNPEELILHGYLEKAPTEVTVVLENKTQEIKQLNTRIKEMSEMIKFYNSRLSQLKGVIADIQADIQEEEESGRSLADNVELFDEKRRRIIELLTLKSRIEELQQDKHIIEEAYALKLQDALRYQLDRLPPSEEIHDLLNKYTNLPEKDRKELLDIAEMKHKYIQTRTLDIAAYIKKTKATARQVAQVFEVSEDTVYKDMAERLPLLDNDLAQEVKEILEKNEEAKKNG